MVGRGFESDEHHVAHADVLRRAGALRVDVKIAFSTADEDAAPPHDIVIATEEEMDFLPVATELGAIVGNNRA